MTDRKALWQRLRRVAALVAVSGIYLLLLPTLIVTLWEGRPWSWLAALAALRREVALVLLVALCAGALQQLVALRHQPRRFSRQLQAEGVSYLLLADRELVARHPLDKRDGDLWGEIATLVPIGEYLAFDCVGSAEQVMLLVTGLPHAARAAATQLMAHWPGTQLRPLVGIQEPLARLAAETELYHWHCHIRPTARRHPIQPAVADPALALLSEVARLPEGVQGGLQLLVGPNPYSGHNLEQTAIRKSVPILNHRNRRYEELYRQPWETTVIDRSDQRDIEEWSARANRRFLDVQLVVWAAATDLAPARQHARQLARTAVAQYGPRNPLRLTHEAQGSCASRQRRLFAGGNWTDQELGTLFHLFGREGVAVAPTLAMASAKILPPAAANRLIYGQPSLVITGHE